MKIPHLWCPVPVVTRALEPPLPPPGGRCRLPGAQKARPRPRAFLANERFSFFLCCRFLKVVKEPEPQEPSQEKLTGLPVSTGLAEQIARAGLECGPGNPSLKGHPTPAAVCLCFLFFSQHAPRGPAPPMAQSSHPGGQGCPQPGPHPCRTMEGS